MKGLKLVLVAISATSALGSVETVADPTEPPGETREVGATNADASAWEQPNLPGRKVDMSRDWYPDAAKRLGLEGRVLLGFDMKADGRAKNISVIWSENSAFEASAVEMLKSVRFTVPANWKTADASRRWRMGLVYRLYPSCRSDQSDQFAIPVDKVVITGSRLAGAPVRSGSGANNSEGGCAHH